MEGVKGTIFHRDPAQQLTAQALALQDGGRRDHPTRGPGYRRGRPSGWLELVAAWAMAWRGEPWTAIAAGAAAEWQACFPAFWDFLHKGRPLQERSLANLLARQAG